MKRSYHKNRGFSLIELMIALVLGVVIVGGCISIFTGVVRSSSLNQTISNLQSNARFTLDMMGRDIRAAGFLGCSAERNVALNITVGSPPTTDLSSSAVTGYVVSDTGWAPSMPLSYTAPTGVGKPVPGTHALSVQYAEYPGFLLSSSMSANNSAITLTNNVDRTVSVGQLMVLSDCSSADLFSVSSVNTNADKLVIGPAASLTKRYALVPGFTDSTRAMPFISTIYYVGDTLRVSEAGDKVFSLYAHRYPYTAANPPLELIEGVDQLVLEFGVRQADGSMLYTLAGGAGYRDEGVETVRVGLLLSSLKRFAEVDAERTYTLAGQSVTAAVSADAAGDESGTAGSPVPPASTATTLSYTSDKRMRMPFNATFNVRNRNL